MTPTGPFGFVQFEFGYLLGPVDGRYLMRDHASQEPRSVVVIGTFGAPQRHRLKGRGGRKVTEGEPAPVPISRATVVKPAPFGDAAEATRWMKGLKDESLETELTVASSELNALLRAHRAATSDHTVRDVAPSAALVTRVGYGIGEQVADGKYEQATELPYRPPRRRRSEQLSPQERLAAVVGGREAPLASEELILRARTDVDAGHWREAALQARIGLECLLAELAQDGARFAVQIEEHREPLSSAGNSALDGTLSQEQREQVAEAVTRMESALHRFRLDKARKGTRDAS